MGNTEAAYQRGRAESIGQASYQRGRAEAREEEITRLSQIVQDMLRRGHIPAEIQEFIRRYHETESGNRSTEVTVADLVTDLVPVQVGNK